MGKESRVIISGHQYRYEYDENTKTTKYLGPVGDAPEMSEADFMAAMNIPKKIKFSENQKQLWNHVLEWGSGGSYAYVETGEMKPFNMLTVRSLRDKGLVEVSKARGTFFDPDKRIVLEGSLIGDDVFFVKLTEKGKEYAVAYGYQR
jgi:hypothetical protein